MFELAGDVVGAEINASGELELAVETEDGDKTFNLGKVKGRTPYFQLNDKVLEIKYDDESSWAALIDFSTIASTFDLRLNEETYFLEAQREVDGEWEPMVDLSALKLAHEHGNKAVLDKFTQESLKLIGEIPGVLDKLSEPIKQQLKESLYSEEEESVGFSANTNTFPVGDSVWVEGKAVGPCPLYAYSGLKKSWLDVVTTTTSNSTYVEAKIRFELDTQNYPSILDDFISLLINFPFAEVKFKDDATIYMMEFYSTIANGSILTTSFIFLNGYPTFPLTGNFTKNIEWFYVYPRLGSASHSEGDGTVALGSRSHVQGRYNELDTKNKYAHIIGNGRSHFNRSNAHTVDWEGNAWYAGGISAKNLSLEEPIKTSELINDSEFITINDIPESNNLSAMVDGETLVLSSLLGQEIEEAINEIEAMIDESGVLDE